MASDSLLPVPVKIGAFKAWLSLWIILAMTSGIGLGLTFPDLFGMLGGMSVAHVNPVTALLVWTLILPSMVQIDYSQLPTVWSSRNWQFGSVLTLIVNWIIKPFSMTLLAVFFLKIVFAPWIDVADADQYAAGLILLGVAPCTGMVFVWSRMTGGDAGFTLSQVSVNDIVLLFAFAPLAGFLLGASGIETPWMTLEHDHPLWNHSDGTNLRQDQVKACRFYLDNIKWLRAGIGAKAPVPQGFHLAVVRCVRPVARCTSFLAVQLAR